MTYLVAISKPSQELFAARELTNQGCDCYVPICIREVTNRRGVSRRTEPKYLPLLSKYFLFNPNGLPVRIIKNTRAIAGIVEQGDGSPAQVSEREYQRWVEMTSAVQDFRKSAAEYVIGQQLKIEKGPFAGLVGRLLEISSGKVKLELQSETNSLTITTDKTMVSSSFAA